MKIGFIAPALDLDRENKGERIFLLPPLTFPVLAALTPDNVELEIIEERLRPIPYDSNYDLVGLTFVTAFAPHAYAIADKFRKRGIKVVLGGPHVSILPEEALQYADAVVVGEAEEIWGQLLKDFQHGQMQKIYRAPRLIDMSNFPRPRLDVMPKEFIFKKSTLATKGCPFSCKFCFTNSLNQYQQRSRPLADVVRDIEAMDGNWINRNHFVFWDDNLVGNTEYAKELFRSIASLKRKWAAAASVTIADDDELLNLAKKAGCIALFIGMESVYTKSLQESNKNHNQVRKYRDMIEKLHDHGIVITGAFVFGFDHDDVSVFDRTLEFAININLDCMTPAILTPLPGTPLYSQMQQEGRIVDHNWAHYDYFHVVFEPKKMSRKQLYEGFLRFNQEFFSFNSSFKRLGRSRTQLLLATLANLGYRSFYKRMLQEYHRGLRSLDIARNQESVKLKAKRYPSLSHSDFPRGSQYYDTAPSLNRVHLLVDAEEIIPYVYNMLSRAQKRIHLEMYLLEGNIGERITELLRRKAASGVDVRLIYQPPASLDAYKKIMTLLNRLGLRSRVVSYRTFHNTLAADKRIHIAPFPLHLFCRKTSLKMAHNKVLIVDSEEAMIGGMNFASITERNHDVMVAVRGPIVCEMEKAFRLNWELADGNNQPSYSLADPKIIPHEESPDNAWVSYLVTLPYLENTKEFLLNQILKARERILIEMYLFSDPELVSAIIAAAKRGIEVRILLDANRLPLELDLNGFPNKITIHKLINANVPVRVFRCEPGQEMHMKVALFDDDKAVVGSTNWTTGSFTVNSESCFFIMSKSIHQKLRQLFERDWHENSENPESLSLPEKIIAATLQRFRRVY